MLLLVRCLEQNQQFLDGEIGWEFLPSLPKFKAKKNAPLADAMA